MTCATCHGSRHVLSRRDCGTTPSGAPMVEHRVHACPDCCGDQPDQKFETTLSALRDALNDE